MPAFRYEATDLVGKIVHGTLDAETERGARNQLRARGLLPLSTVLTASRQGGASLRQRRFSDTELAWLTRQLSSLPAARLPLAAPPNPTPHQPDNGTEHRRVGKQSGRQ